MPHLQHLPQPTTPAADNYDDLDNDCNGLLEEVYAGRSNQATLNGHCVQTDKSLYLSL